MQHSQYVEKNYRTITSLYTARWYDDVQHESTASHGISDVF